MELGMNVNPFGKSSPSSKNQRGGVQPLEFAPTKVKGAASRVHRCIATLFTAIGAAYTLICQKGAALLNKLNLGVDPSEPAPIREKRKPKDNDEKKAVYIFMINKVVNQPKTQGVNKPISRLQTILNRNDHEDPFKAVEAQLIFNYDAAFKRFQKKHPYLFSSK